MKNRVIKLGIFLAAALALLIMQACDGKDPQPQQKPEDQITISTLTTVSQENEEDIFHLDPSAFSVLQEEDGNYQLYTNQESSGYYYRVLGHDGILMDEGYLSWQFLGFEKITEDVLMLKTGSGGAQASVKLYDLGKRRVSCLLPNVLGFSDGLIAYFEVGDDGVCLVVQDAFDPSGCHYTFSDGSLTENVFFTTECGVAFESQNTAVKLTYPDADGSLITKTFSLAD